MLLCDSTAATRILKLSTTLLSISCGIHLIFLLMMSSLVCGCFHKFCFSGTPSENSQAGWDLGNRMVRGYRFERNESVPWEVMPEVFKYSVREMRCHLISRTGHSSHFPWDREQSLRKQSLRKQSTDKRGNHQKRNQTDSTRNAQ